MPDMAVNQLTQLHILTFVQKSLPRKHQSGKIGSQEVELQLTKLHHHNGTVQARLR